jgi:hypothetical protein
MKSVWAYVIASLLAGLAVLGSIAGLLALAKAQEQKLINRVVVLQVDEKEPYNLSQALSWTEQVALFAQADLGARRIRHAYSSEKALDDVIRFNQRLLLDWIEACNREVKAYLGGTVLSPEVILAAATVSAALYESPSGATRLPYWLITYQWHLGNEQDLSVKQWPVYMVEVYCETKTSLPYCLNYRYDRIIQFSEICGIAVFANALGVSDQLEVTDVAKYDSGNASADSWVYGEVMIDAQIHFFFALQDQPYGIMKVIYIAKEPVDSIRLVPNQP